ncbi:hypothetical protein [Actinoplanes derwentensis]|uniref:Leucine rich repeat variant n=1 Tax=Actinoplanes derwentensis TaxID=113562 RepID=A0A1H1VSH7_9ACTN|nr:hypothetical protein [Actinoplanes derwentensis]GID83608.1 hypothetical protein Ade03nite_25320 [Actinoplanes derwentensis]SDS87410.1 Leucine rich repeat variant [Actinoplanes derwentensis]
MEYQYIRSAAENKLGLLRVHEARSTATTEQRLRELAADPIRPVRVWTARNPNTPPDAVATLLQDADCSVRNEALYHLRTPAVALELLARQEAEEAEAARLPNTAAKKRHVVAHHPNTPPQLRDELIAAGVCPGRRCGMAAEFRHRCGDGRLYAEQGKPTSAPGPSPHTGSPPAMGDATDIEAGARSAGEAEWLSVLRALDEPGRLGSAGGLEFPGDFDRAATQTRFDQLVDGLSEAFGCPLLGGQGPQEDAARFGIIRIPAQVTRTHDRRSGACFPLAVILSNFGGLTTCLPYRVGPAPDAGPTPPVHQEDYRRVEQVSAELQLRLVPERILGLPYEGPNYWVSGSEEATWFWRFFDYL